MAENRRAHAEALLLEADRAYGVLAGSVGVNEALEYTDDGNPFVEWVLDRLHTNTLITPDELAMYVALDREGKVDAIAEAHDLSQVQAVSEDEIRLATQELQRSTDAIRKQTETLQLQRQGLDRSVQKRAGSDRRRRDLEIVQQRKWEIEHKQLTGEVESLSYWIEQRVEDASQDGDRHMSTAQTLIAESLRSDDKLLASLQKLGREIDRQEPHEAETIERMRDICLRLIKTTVETIRTRLDRVYLETLTSAVYQHHTQPPSSAEIKELGDEVESLYSEILPVAQMSVEQQRLDPAVKGISARDGHTLHHSAISLTYVSGCLEHVIAKMNCLTQHIESASKHRAQSAFLIAAAQEELSKSTSPPVQPAPQAVPASPVRRPSPTRMRARTANAASRRRSSGILEVPAIDSLLESLGVQIPIDQSGADAHFKHLSQAVEERNSKRSDITRNAQASYEAITTSHLDDMRTAMQLLNDSALAETPYGKVKFVDADFEASIDLLKTEVEQARESLSRLEMKHAGKKSERKEDMVNRWTT